MASKRVQKYTINKKELQRDKVKLKDGVSNKINDDKEIPYFFNCIIDKLTIKKCLVK